MDDQQQNEDRMRRALQTIKKLQQRLEIAERNEQKSIDEPIAVIGMSCRFPGGCNSPEAFWQLLDRGGDAITQVPADRWDAKSYYHPQPATPGKIITTDGGFLDSVREFDAHFFGIAPKEAASLDPQQRMLLEVSWEAMERAGVVPAQWNGQKIGVFVGISAHDYSRHLMARPLHEIDAYLATGNSHSVAAGRLSYTFGFTGPSLGVDTACSSSLVALHAACQGLHSGECRAALVGGVNCILSPELSMTFS
ncbi:MAG TPA: beta-ketoacyl synthase, partial [Planctomycetaceae bacterium]|nr:beta-ketoacyl synthase [Planctomycetaceae bacterium]